MIRTIVLGAALLCSILALVAVIWIVVPPLNYTLFQVAVGVGEWSLWPGLIAALGVALGLIAARGGSRWGWLAIAAGLLAIGCALVPPIQASGVARASGGSISLRRFVFGTPGRPIPPVTTETFATVDGTPLQLDVYRPPDDTPGPLPAIVVVHGGSWSGGDKSDFGWWSRWLAQQGYAVFDIQYRLAPQPNWQTATADVKCAIGWVRRNADRYRVDADRLALLGRSAGGHLALLAAYTPGDPALPPSCDAPDTGVRAVVSLYGPADLVWGYNHARPTDVIDGPATLRRFLGGDPQSAAQPFAIASPITHVGARTPPTLLLHGQRDSLVSDRHATLLAERLRAAGVEHRLVLIPYAQHGFDYNLNGWSGQIMQPILLDFLRAHLAR